MDTSMEMSVHAQLRAQQRGVPTIIVEWLELYGEETYDHNGARILHFSKRSIRDLERYVGREVVRRMSEYMRCYAVLSTAGGIITVGKLFRRVRRPA